MIDLVLARPGLLHAAEKHWCLYPPLGLAYLAGTARARGVSVEVVDGKLEGHLDDKVTVEKIMRHHPRRVGISAMTVDFPKARKIAGLIKKINPETVLILGGVHANALEEKALEEAVEFDLLMAGESETTLVEFIQGTKKKDEIAGLFWRNEEGKIMNGAPAHYDEDVDSLPFPAWDMFPRTQIYPVMSERGCPFNCVFCCRNMSKKVKRRSLDKVMEEIEWLHENFSPREIYFEDETFGSSPEKAAMLLKRLIEFSEKAKVTFKAQTRVDRVTEEMTDLMRKAGFEYIELGVESGDPEVLKASKKGISLEQVEKAVKTIKKSGLKVWFKIIIGLPGETMESFQRTMDFTTRQNPDRLSVATIVAYPGSDIYDWAEKGEKGYRLLTKEWDKYDKYISNSIELENIPHRALKRMQIQFYLELYLRNRRYGELAKLLLSKFSLSLMLLKSYIASLFSRK